MMYLFLALTLAAPTVTTPSESTVGPTAFPTFAHGCGSHDLVDAPDDAQAHGGRALRGGEVARVAVKAHVVRRSDGTGGIRPIDVQRSIDDLNRIAWKDIPVVFVLVDGIDYIDSDLFYDCPDRATIDALRSTNHDPTVMNVYWANSLYESTLGANVLGISAFPNTPTLGIAQTRSTAISPYLDNVLSHEVGHFYRLWHTNQSTIEPECVDGSNCSQMGDRICDTPASPGMSLTGNIDWLGNYFGTALGPCPGDAPYAPDADNLMESNPHIWMTMDSFTPQQVDRMVDTALNNGRRNMYLDPDILRTFVDRNENGMDDITEILSGAAVDSDGDWVPDEASLGLDEGDLIVTAMNASYFQPGNVFAVNPDGSYEYSVDYSSNWMHSARFGPDGMLYFAAGLFPATPHVPRVNPKTNVRDLPNGVFALGPAGAGTFVDLLFPDADTMLVLDNSNAVIHRFDAATGDSIDTFASLAAQGVSGPKYMELGPDGHIYIVGNGAQGDRVHKVDSATGAYLGAFTAPGAGGLAGGQGLTFHGGHLYVADGPSNSVLRFNAMTGAFVDVFIASGSGGLSNPHCVRFGPDGHACVASRNTSTVKKYDGVTGAPLGDLQFGVDAAYLPTSLAGLAFVPDLCFADIDDNAALNIDDIGLFVSGFLSGDATVGDCNGNGAVNIDDIDCFVAGFLAGCP
ncbi:MAG: M43 family zinc metalloprotease [Phycisphaerales bacterium]